MRLQHKKSITIVLLACLIWLQSCKNNEINTPEEKTTLTTLPNRVVLTEAQYNNANLLLAAPKKMKIGHIITLNGKVEVMPENTISVSSPMAGFIRQIKWIPGMTVKKGEVLVRLEEKEFIQLQQDYLSAKNVLAYAKLDLERQTELSKNQASSDKVLQQAEEKVKQSQILVTSLATKLRLIQINPATLHAENITSQIVITAPATGTITEVAVNLGKYVEAGENIITIMGFNGSKLVLKAFEKDLPFLKKGQKVFAYSNAEPDKKITGKIDYIVRNIGEEGFANIICSPDNVSEQLFPGLYLNVDIEAQSMESWTVPEDAIILFEGKEYVFVEKETRTYEMVKVSTGQKENKHIQILNEQDIKDQKVVIKGAYTLLMKMKNVEE
jgi:cobalt-zinc-cadmium efflux system membrane fusion protein